MKALPIMFRFGNAVAVNSTVDMVELLVTTGSGVVGMGMALSLLVGLGSDSAEVASPLVGLDIIVIWC